MTVTRTTASSSSSFWTRERAVAVGILQALVAVAAGCASVVAGHPAGAPIADGVGVVAFLASYLIRQGVFSESTVAEIGKDAALASNVGAVLGNHAEDVVTIVNSLAGDLRALRAGNLAPIAADAYDFRQVLADPALVELEHRVAQLEAARHLTNSDGTPVAAPESAPAAPTDGPAYPTPAPAAPAV